MSKKYKILSISSVIYYEVGIGNRNAHFDYWNNLSEKFQILPFDKDCADYAIIVYLDLVKRNQIIDLADLLIASAALRYDLPITTLNVKHFERIKGFKIIKSLTTTEE